MWCRKIVPHVMHMYVARMRNASRCMYVYMNEYIGSQSYTLVSSRSLQYIANSVIERPADDSDRLSRRSVTRITGVTALNHLNGDDLQQGKLGDNWISSSMLVVDAGFILKLR